MSTFEIALAVVLKNEGRYINDPDDAGGETNFGISKRSYPDLDIKNLTLQEASAIYRKDYWDAYQYSRINTQTIATKIFDMAVNMGPSQAHKLAQRSVWAWSQQPSELLDDGIMGNNTLGAINHIGGFLIATLRSEQANYYRRLVIEQPTKQKYLQGWLNRAYEI